MAAMVLLRHASSSWLLLLLLAACAWLLCHAGAVEHMVGNGNGDNWDSGINYVAWAQKQTFAVGDVLVFQYVKTQHNVYEVTESTYRSCDATGGVRAMYTSGFDKVVLAEARTYFFICDFPGHCLGGMKVAVNVSASGGVGPPSPNAAPLPPTGSAAPSPAGAWLAMGLALGVLGFINRIIR